MIETFTDIAQDIAGRLNEGATNRRSAMHLGTVATADADARIMVLRAYDAETRTLRFHTDVRSPKCTLIGDGAPVGVLFYDMASKIQMRCRGVGRIEHNTPLADSIWEENTNFARRCYLGEGPGAASDVATSGLPEWIEGKEPTAEQVAPARPNFAILLVELDEVDWFYLSNDGHRRAVMNMATGEGRWIAP